MVSNFYECNGINFENTDSFNMKCLECNQVVLKFLIRPHVFMHNEYQAILKEKKSLEDIAINRVIKDIASDLYNEDENLILTETAGSEILEYAVDKVFEYIIKYTVRNTVKNFLRKKRKPVSLYCEESFILLPHKNSNSDIQETIIPRKKSKLEPVLKFVRNIRSAFLKMDIIFGRSVFIIEHHHLRKWHKAAMTN